MHKPSIYAMIPARYGSTRLKMKNLALINDQPLISYAIQASKNSFVFDRVIVNSENKIFEKIAERYNCDFYLRPNLLGSSTAKSDSVVYDFMQSFQEAEIVAWVNPIAPFQTHDEITEVVNFFLQNNLDSLITVENKQVHCLYKGTPVNFDTKSVFAQTQDLEPVQPFVYSVMMWKSEVFIREFEKNGHALFCGKFDVFPVRKSTELIVKTKEDLILADQLMRAKERKDSTVLSYDEILDRIE